MEDQAVIQNALTRKLLRGDLGLASVGEPRGDQCWSAADLWEITCLAQTASGRLSPHLRARATERIRWLVNHWNVN